MATDQTMSDIYSDGWLAYSHDEPHINPYPPQSYEFDAWEDGWLSAEKARGMRRFWAWPWELI